MSSKNNSLKSYYLVIFEWDGIKVPSAFPRFLKTIGTARFGDDIAGETERFTEMAVESDGENGSVKARHVVAQEGTFATESESTVQAVIGLFKELYERELLKPQYSGEMDTGSPETRKYRRRYPRYYVFDAMPDFAFSGDVKLAQNIKRASRAASRMAEEVWYVSCHECVGTHRVKAKRPVLCPNCGGMHVSASQAAPLDYKDSGEPILDLWLKTRFVDGIWVPSPVIMTESLGGTSVPKETPTLSPQQARVHTAMASAKLGEQLTNFPRNVALEFLDAIYAGQTIAELGTVTKFHERRVDAVIHYKGTVSIKNGMITPKFMLRNGEVDLFHAAQLLGKEEVVDWIAKYGRSA